MNIENRFFNYYFSIDEEVQIEEKLFLDENFYKYKQYVGKVGIIKKVYSDMHVWGKGCVYSCDVEFNDKERINDMLCAYLRYSNGILEKLSKFGYIVTETGEIIKK